MVILNIVLAVIAFILLSFGLGWFGLEYDKVFMPKRVALERSVFEHSKVYNDGMLRDLENLEMQYRSASSEQKEALKAVILHRFSVYPESELPPNLRNFYNDLRNL